MPKQLERALAKEAAKKGLKGKVKDRYIYGTMVKDTSWRPNQKKKK